MMVMMVLVVEMMMMMMITMKSSSMTMTMATVSPLREGFPRQISLCQRAFLSLVFSASQQPWNLFLVAPRVLDFRGDDIRGRASPEVGQGGHTMPRHGLTLAHAWGRCGALVAPFGSPSGSVSLLSIYDHLYIFLDFFDLPKYCILTALFPAES